MSALAFQLNVVFDRCTCSECGVPFAAPDTFFSKRREDHRTFYCPNGHGQHYPAKSEAEKLRDELAAEKQRKEAALCRLNEAEQREAKVLRKLKRVQRGVCPECNRSFNDLARHMACKHTPKVV